MSIGSEWLKLRTGMNLDANLNVWEGQVCEITENDWRFTWICLMSKAAWHNTIYISRDRTATKKIRETRLLHVIATIFLD